ncbi:phosphatase PAP2 family protein [Candidatus Desantisbacteria bacterium]|nr:phosphatase PAP2 family protein [Candidatus Desantisbacteria bacterium]
MPRIVFLLLALLAPGYAQCDNLNIDYWKEYASDTKACLLSPSHWDSSDWMKASLVTGITAGLYVFDEDIQKWIQENRSNTSDKISRFVKPFGDGRYTLPAIGTLYLYGYFSEDEKAQKTALLGLESFVISNIFTQTIKFAGHRHSPNTGDPCNRWAGFSTSNLSFPSNHTSSAFAIATVIASEYKDKPLIPLASYGIAALTGLSRMNDNCHWASDVFFGASIGYFAGKTIVRLHSDKIILPIINGQYAALLTVYNF